MSYTNCYGLNPILILIDMCTVVFFSCHHFDSFDFKSIAAIIPAAARTASAHGSTSAHSTQQIYGASNIVAGRTSPSTLTGTSAAALSFAAMEQMQMQNRLYSA